MANAAATDEKSELSRSTVACLSARSTADLLSLRACECLFGAQYRGVDAHPRAHGGRNREAFDVLSLRRSRLWFQDGIHESAKGLEGPLLGERHLAHGRVNDRGLVDPELDLARLDLLDRSRDLERHRAGLGVGHEPSRTEE